MTNLKIEKLFNPNSKVIQLTNLKFEKFFNSNFKLIY